MRNRSFFLVCRKKHTTENALIYQKEDLKNYRVGRGRRGHDHCGFSLEDRNSCGQRRLGQKGHRIEGDDIGNIVRN